MIQRTNSPIPFASENGFARNGLAVLNKSKHKALLFGALLFACAIAMCVAPQSAYAKSYSMPNVHIEATIQDNGDLRVVEQRQFDFDGNFTAVWWSYNNLPSGASLSMESVRMASIDDSGAQGSWITLSGVSFQEEWRSAGGPGTQAYSFDRQENTVYAFFDETDSQVVFELTYVVRDAVQAYSDVGELYWQFVGDQWQEDSANVSLTLSLPAPEGATIQPGENVYAWGHGPLDASVEINSDATITYQVPLVSAGSYAEARVLIPSGWLSGMSASDSNAHFASARLDTVLNEERTWADRANAQRATALGVLLVVVVGCLVMLVWGIRSFVRYGKELEPDFKDDYWRDIPVQGEHPAVIGRLWRFDKEDTADFAATIMHLANEGALVISKGSYEVDGVLKSKTVEDYYLTRVPEQELKLNSELDRQAMSLLFDTIAQGQPSFWLGSIKAFADEHPQELNAAMMRWQGLVTSHTIAGEYFESYSKTKRSRMACIAVIIVVVCAVIGFAFSNPLTLIPGIIAGVALFVVSRFMDRRTQKGVDAYARCKALKKWLTEFSSLNERPSSDVKVWGEFMVYAYLFGVAEEAMRELRNVVPEVASDDGIASGAFGYVPWWIWYNPALGSSSLPDVGASLEGALTESIAASASAIAGSVSSGAGMGGGFSVGGGGGFGGGGGAR